MGNSRWLVFTDLDGTLLDHDTYSFEPARPALQALEERGVPLVLCTSKTRSETERWRQALGNAHPFVVENGGGAFVPRGYFPFEVGGGESGSPYEELVFGTPYMELRRVLAGMKSRIAPALRGFGDMTDEEVAGLCGFSVEDARLAKQRDYDEPFVAGDGASLEALEAAAAEAGLRIVRGGRFLHLIGANDKGRAVSALRGLYEKARGPFRTVGLGDSLNDEPMLRAVDIPVVVGKPGGGHDPGIDLPGLVRAPGAGPRGWREAVLGILSEREASRG
jgi:mannosyl-3-phosphoglycerate phosphatase